MWSPFASPSSSISVRSFWTCFAGLRLYLFSTGDDGCLCIFDIKKNGPPRKDKDHPAVVASCCCQTAWMTRSNTPRSRCPLMFSMG